MSAPARQAPPGATPYDVASVRESFPALHQQVHGRPLVYLDNAATTQKPRAVLEEMTRFYSEDASNVHRGVHALSARATKAFERAREVVQRFIGAATEREIVFTRGTTESINLVAQSFVRPRTRPGDEVLVSAMEHHSNIVPWQMLCEQTGAVLKVIPMDEKGQLVLGEYEELLTARTRIVAVVHVSNALGTVNPVQLMIRMAHERGIPVVVDGAQAVAHSRLDVQELDSDFYAFSGHKLYGPFGIGVLHGKLPHLEAMPPWQGGGDMIRSVSFEKVIYNRVPFKFEAGTPNVAGAIGLAKAMEYLDSIGLDAIAAHEAVLLERATERIRSIPGVRIVGEAADKAAVLSFVVEGVHPHDIGTALDQQGVAIRTGNHCAEPAMRQFGLPATARASFALYNTIEEVDVFADALERAIQLFR